MDSADLNTSQLTLTPITGAPANVAVPFKPQYKLPYPKKLFKIHTMAAFVGQCGSGKTNAATLLALPYFAEGYFTNVYIISPTIENNQIFFTLGLKDEDVYSDFNNPDVALQDVLRKVDELAVAYKDKLLYKKAYQAYKKGKETYAMRVLLTEKRFEKPEEAVRPVPLLILDDLSHSRVYSTSRQNPMVNLALRHRHISEGIGISIFMLVQNFKSVPRALRQNISVFAIFRTEDVGQLEEIYEELAGTVTLDEFLSAFYEATKDSKHDFLAIDRFNGDFQHTFRKNWDQYITLPERDRENGYHKRKRK